MKTGTKVEKNITADRKEFFRDTSATQIKKLRTDA